MTILDVRNISFNYRQQNFFRGIRNVSLQLKPGEVMALVGKSGGGKTTLLKCIYGLEDLDSGEILLDGEKVLGPAFNLIPGHEEMKLVSQEYYVLENHTVEENIFDKLIGYTDEAKSKRAARLLNLLELTPLKNTRAKYLSSGQKQRVAIARALAVFPKILLLDEPFSNLDKLLTEKLFHFILNESQKNKTAVLLITHLPEEALKYAQKIAVIDQGKIVQQGDTWKLYYKPKNSRLAGLLGSINTLRKEDLEKSSTLKIRSKLFLRPDKLLPAVKGNADLHLTVSSSTYNGKCYEVLTETKNGHTVQVYSSKLLQTGSGYYFKISV